MISSEVQLSGLGDVGGVEPARNVEVVEAQLRRQRGGGAGKSLEERPRVTSGTIMEVHWKSGCVETLLYHRKHELC